MYNSDLHKRHSIRLRNYDYANIGAYFVTVCLNERIMEIGYDFHKGQQSFHNGQTHRSAPTDMYFDFPTLGYIENGVVILNDFGKMVEKWILKIKNDTDKFSNINLDEYVIMPDHIHAIIEINKQNIPANISVGADPRVCPDFPLNLQQNSVKLGTVIQWFKTMVSNEYIENVKINNWIPFNKRLWQRDFWEHIVKDEPSYKNISKYIMDNPANWGKVGVYLER